MSTTAYSLSFPQTSVRKNAKQVNVQASQRAAKPQTPMSSSHECQARTLTIAHLCWVLRHGFSSERQTVPSLPLSLIVIRSHIQNFANTYLKFLTEANYEPLYIVSSSKVATLPNLCLKTLVLLLKDFDYSPLNKLCEKSQDNCWRNPLMAT